MIVSATVTYTDKKHIITMDILTEILRLIRTVNDEFSLPRIRRIYVPPVRKDKQHADFGLVLLDDRSAGLFYVPDNGPLHRLNRVETDSFVGLSAWHLARELTSTDLGRRAIAFGTASAITQHFFDRAGYVPGDYVDMDYTLDDHVGMVGLFPTIVDRFRARGIRLTVIEKRIDFVQTDTNFTVTLDPTRLGSCNKILCTAATLLNGTIDEILSHCSKAQWISVIGPSAGCFPDPLFAHGVRAVGATRITDPDTLLERMQAGDTWRESVKKYTLVVEQYPGIKKLLQRVRRRSIDV